MLNRFHEQCELLIKPCPWQTDTLGTLGWDFFFKDLFFLCRPLLKSPLNLLQYCLFYVEFFGHEAGGILAPPLEIKSSSLPVEDKS